MTPLEAGGRQSRYDSALGLAKMPCQAWELVENAKVSRLDLGTKRGKSQREGLVAPQLAQQLAHGYIPTGSIHLARWINR